MTSFVKAVCFYFELKSEFAQRPLRPELPGRRHTLQKYFQCWKHTLEMVYWATGLCRRKRRELSVVYLFASIAFHDYE